MIHSDYAKAGRIKLTCLKFGSIYWVREQDIISITPSVTSTDRNDFKNKIVQEDKWVGSCITLSNKVDLFVKQVPDVILQMLDGQSIDDDEYESKVAVT